MTPPADAITFGRVSLVLNSAIKTLHGTVLWALSFTLSFMPGGLGGSCVQSWPLPRAGRTTHAELLIARSAPCCNGLGHLHTRNNQGKTLYLHRSAGPGTETISAFTFFLRGWMRV
ncbi:uncharacterized protein ACIBXB_017052 isoform 1-T1 [Morphnus guianensis]